jgi:phage FluMu protein gp41
MGDSLTARDVLGVGDANVNGPFFQKFFKALRKHALSRVSENIADK